MSWRTTSVHTESAQTIQPTKSSSLQAECSHGSAWASHSSQALWGEPLLASLLAIISPSGSVSGSITIQDDARLLSETDVVAAVSYLLLKIKVQAKGFVDFPNGRGRKLPHAAVQPLNGYRPDLFGLGLRLLFEPRCPCCQFHLEWVYPTHVASDRHYCYNPSLKSCGSPVRAVVAYDHRRPPVSGFGTNGNAEVHHPNITAANGARHA